MPSSWTRAIASKGQAFEVAAVSWYAVRDLLDEEVAEVAVQMVLEIKGA